MPDFCLIALCIMAIEQHFFLEITLLQSLKLVVCHVAWWLDARSRLKVRGQKKKKLCKTLGKSGELLASSLVAKYRDKRGSFRLLHSTVKGQQMRIFTKIFFFLFPTLEIKMSNTH